MKKWFYIFCIAIVLIAAAILFFRMGKPFGKEAKESYELEYWTEGSPVAQSIKDYVRDVCDENSPAYVPVEDRIATFDMDGTFIGELYPTYFDTCMFVYRVLEDERYQPDPEMKEFAQSVREAMNNDVSRS